MAFVLPIFFTIKRSCLERIQPSLKERLFRYRSDERPTRREQGWRNKIKVTKVANEVANKAVSRVVSKVANKPAVAREIKVVAVAVAVARAAAATAAIVN